MIKHLTGSYCRQRGRTAGATMKRCVTAVFAAAALATAIAACGTAGATQTRTDAATSPPAPANSTSAHTPPPAARSAGKYVGSCDYTLNDNFNSSIVAWATGDIEVTNTGNVGIVVTLKITWPQQGFPSLASHKTVRLAYGGRRDIQFHLPLNQNQISNLQNWQQGHNDSTGCTYKATIVSSFGTPQ